MSFLWLTVNVAIYMANLRTCEV